ncbi:hypothetical protein ACJRO7_005224 [Eucalyptus globulus]|uniref:C2H2-type domain-containing protein n=1 Tax=Eucalyptus globulus TaxID=34317 RepID=A0ABD3IYZ6_EUCGL
MEGGKKKRQRSELDASGGHGCDWCEKSFQSQPALNGHMRVHKDRPRRQDKQPKQHVHEEKDEEVVSVLLKLRKGTLNKQEMKGDDGAVSSSAAEVQRKKIHMALDLNEVAPEE